MHIFPERRDEYLVNILKHLALAFADIGGVVLYQRNDSCCSCLTTGDVVQVALVLLPRLPHKRLLIECGRPFLLFVQRSYLELTWNAWYPYNLLGAMFVEIDEQGEWVAKLQDAPHLLVIHRRSE